MQLLSSSLSINSRPASSRDIPKHIQLSTIVSRQFFHDLPLLFFPSGMRISSLDWRVSVSGLFLDSKWKCCFINSSIPFAHQFECFLSDNILCILFSGSFSLLRCLKLSAILFMQSGNSISVALQALDKQTMESLLQFIKWTSICVHFWRTKISCFKFFHVLFAFF